MAPQVPLDGQRRCGCGNRVDRTGIAVVLNGGADRVRDPLPYGIERRFLLIEGGIARSSIDGNLFVAASAQAEAGIVAAAMDDLGEPHGLGF